MSRILFIIAVVGIALWWLFGRRRSGDTRSEADAAVEKKAAPQEMVACAHCGVHLPKADTVVDAEGRPFCGEPHRLAGPR